LAKTITPSIASPRCPTTRRAVGDHVGRDPRQEPRLESQPRRPRRVDQRHRDDESPRLGVASDLEVAVEGGAINAALARFDPRPLDAQAYAVEPEARRQVEDALVVAPQVVGLARPGVAPERDGRRVAGGRLVGPVEAALRAVALQRREHTG